MSEQFAVLRAQTPEAYQSIHGDELELRDMPFRGGRESRLGVSHGMLVMMERRKGTAPPNNDFYFIDEGDPLQMSRRHFVIEKDGADYFLVDQKSECGTVVDGQHIGGEGKGGRCRLHPDSEIILGSPGSPYRFRFVLPA